MLLRQPSLNVDTKQKTTTFLLMKLAIIIAVAFVFIVSAPKGLLAVDSISQIERLSAKIDYKQLFPEAARMGAPEGEPKAAPVYSADNALIGYIFVNTDFVPTIGYSGKPIHVAIAMDMQGSIKGAKLLKHSEPIVLVGIPNAKIKAFIDGYVGLNAITLAKGGDDPLPVDIVSGATVTVIVIDVSIKRSAVLLAKSRGIGGLDKFEAPRNILRTDINTPSDWGVLFGDGSIKHLLLTNADVDQAFVDSGNKEAIARPEKGKAEDVFIHLHTALVSQPQIGRTLLGDREYKNLTNRLKKDQHAVLIMAKGHYSFRGSGFVRGGIFDRFQIVQGTNSWLLTDKLYKNMGNVHNGPNFKEVGLFRLPENSEFDPTASWRVQLLIQRAVGPIQKAFVVKALDYIVPPRFVEQVKVKVPEHNEAEFIVNPVVKKVWENKKISVAVLTIALILLIAIFYGQLWLARKPVLLKTVRVSFLLFTLVWLGWYSNAQLSIVNVFTFAQSFVNDFSWNYFMMDPLLFILWFAVASALILWGRGVFCGWLCPFGALQELTNMLAKKIGIPQIRVPWGLHELLLSLKYTIFLILFGLSLYSMGIAEQYAEIEPFKTVIILKFAREWPYVVYALTLLSVGLVIERFYCRYLCPLGAALAIPARLRTNDWLKRYFMCGNPCQRCANECMVQAIRPDGQIHPNECINCMHCQELYSCSARCPVRVQKRERTEKRLKSQEKEKQL